MALLGGGDGGEGWMEEVRHLGINWDYIEVVNSPVLGSCLTYKNGVGRP